MTYPKLPVPARGEVLLICTCYEDDSPEWSEVFDELGARREGEVVAVGEGRVPLRLVEDPAWDFVRAGDLPALFSRAGSPAPVAAVADGPVVFGGDDVLLVDLRDVPGRGVRVPAAELDGVLERLLGGTLRFDELVRGMDRFGVYGGEEGAPAALATPTAVLRTSFPQLPASSSTLLVRTDFGDEQGWRAFLDALGEPSAGSELPAEDVFYGQLETAALVVDDRAFEGLQPGQVPALVPPLPPEQHTTMAALADATTLKDPAYPLFVVNLYDTPGQATRIPFAGVETMAVNLQLANAEFADFVKEWPRRE